ncbi:MAG: hypothetical protein QG623_457 [Patescibacteria group bacterium]|nr:hypothetical protein [Patescibacteria group bacterium]
MGLYRYSAIGTFGIPLTEGNIKTLGDDSDGLFKILDANDLEPQAVPTEPTDITPYYWDKNNMIYIASLAHPEGPAAILSPCVFSILDIITPQIIYCKP